MLDPSRVAAQVVSGIGFLGAGVIIFRKNAVRGLTTAAIILAIQAGLRPIERHFFQHHRTHQLELRVTRGEGQLAAIESAITGAGFDLRGLRLRPVRGGRADRIALDLGPLAPAHAASLIDGLRHMDGVQVVSYSLGDFRSANDDGDDENRSIGDDSG